MLLELGNEVGDHAARNLIDQRAGLGSENIGIEKAGIDALLLDRSKIIGDFFELLVIHIEAVAELARA